MPVTDLDIDPKDQKMHDAFKKLTMHQFWKKVKGGAKATGDADEKAEFNKLYKTFNMGLGKILDKYDKAFPEIAEMKKHSGLLKTIIAKYTKQTDESDIPQKTRMALSGTLDILMNEVKRRNAWVKKCIK